MGNLHVGLLNAFSDVALHCTGVLRAYLCRARLCPLVMARCISDHRML